MTIKHEDYMKSVSMNFAVLEGMDAIKFFNELNDAVRDLLCKYEEELDIDMEVSAYILDDEGNAVY